VDAAKLGEWCVRHCSLHARMMRRDAPAIKYR
jgi:hypothetical protein